MEDPRKKMSQGARTVDRAVGTEATPDEVVIEAMRHARAASVLAAAGSDALALGARRVAVRHALKFATTPPLAEQERDVARSMSGGFLPLLDGDHHVHVASLLQAVSWARAERRIAMGLRPYGGSPDSRSNGEDRAYHLRGVPASRPGSGSVDDHERYRATIVDVSSSLSTAIDALRDVLALTKAGSDAEGAWDTFDAAAIELCADPAASLADRLDARRVLLLLWVTVRRRRPLIAAVLRRKLFLDRVRWPGSILGESRND